MEWIDIIIITSSVESFICLYALFRNNWVYKNRIKLLDKDYEEFKKLPSYDDMLIGHGFWIWNINYFLKN